MRLIFSGITLATAAAAAAAVVAVVVAVERTPFARLGTDRRNRSRGWSRCRWRGERLDVRIEI